jgi:hypothetical protein
MTSIRSLLFLFSVIFCNCVLGQTIPSNFSGKYQGPVSFTYGNNLKTTTPNITFNLLTDGTFNFIMDNGCSGSGGVTSSIVLGYLVVDEKFSPTSISCPSLGYSNSNVQAGQLEVLCNASQSCNMSLAVAGNFSILADSLFRSGSASGINPNLVPKTGTWWNSAESGRGYSLQVSTDLTKLLISVWSYDSKGNAIWYQAVASQQGSGYSGTLVQYGSGQTLTGAYQPSTIANPNVGSISVQFTNPLNGTMTLPDGRVIPISYFSF